MKKIYLELDVSGTTGDEAWNAIEQPKGFISAVIQDASDSPCNHADQESHSAGEWREVSVQVEAACFDEAVDFYKKNERILAVETED
ncbi:MAG: hypothetical protein ACE5F7_06525 [Nitrospiria bacterium]